MPRKKERMTLEQHKLAGEILSRLHNEVTIKLSVFFSNRYPKNGNLARKLNQIYEYVNQARSLAEEEMFCEYPNEGNTQIYYPQHSKLEPDNISELVKKLIEDCDKQ